MNIKNISYIVPSYNCQDTLLASIDSIFDQNFIKGDEIVIVDDCSSDGTKKLITKLCSTHKEIVAKYHKKNMGGGATRNTAIKACKNDYIFCLDSDNILPKNSVIHLRKLISIKSVPVVSFGELHYFKSHPDNISHTWKFKYQLYDKQNYLTTNIVPGASGNYLFTKQSWQRAGGYPEYAGALDTWGFGLRQVMSGSTITVVPGTFYLHRIGIESYWVRESRKHSINDLAGVLLQPYDSLLGIYNYYRIYWKPQRDWFFNLDKYPIILKESRSWKTAIINFINRAVFKKI